MILRIHTNMKNIIEYFDCYVRLNLKPIAVYKESKVPVGKNWNLQYSSEYWRDLVKNGDYNIGILLGDIVDVEGDTDEANAAILEMIGGVSHPSYRSSKSIHHLFINPDKNLTRITHNGIEFRAYKHQSVVPPSFHIDGSDYRWIKDSKFPIPEMPKKLLDYYFEIKSKKSKPKIACRNDNNVIHRKNKNKKGYVKTHCNNCKKEFFTHKKRLILETQSFMSHGFNWQCRKCRPIDVREDCREIRKIKNKLYLP